MQLAADCSPTRAFRRILWEREREREREGEGEGEGGREGGREVGQERYREGGREGGRISRDRKACTTCMTAASSSPMTAACPCDDCPQDNLARLSLFQAHTTVSAHELCYDPTLRICFDRICRCGACCAAGTCNVACGCVLCDAMRMCAGVNTLSMHACMSCRV